MDFLKQSFSEFSKNRCSTLAASLAYYTAFALPPLLYLIMLSLTAGLSVFYEGDAAKERAEEVLQTQVSQLIGNPSATEQIDTIIDNAQESSGKWWKTLLSFLGILIGATGVVTALQDALNQVWGVRLDPDRVGIKNMIAKRILSLAMILGIGFLLLVSLVVSSILSSLGDRVGEWIGMSQSVAIATHWAMQAAIVCVVFAAIFKFMPDVETRWKDVTVGAMVTTGLFLAGRFAMQFYFSMAQPGAQLGSAAASLAVLLLWVYYTAMIVLLGAVLTQVYAVRFGHGIQPEPNVVRVVRTIVRDPTPTKT